MSDKSDTTSLTNLMQLAVRDSPGAKDALYKRVYDDLRVVAHRLIRHHRGTELQTTALVNEVVLRFEKADSIRSMKNRRVFFSVATQAMNQVLIDHYRKRSKLVDSPDQTAHPLDIILDEIEEQLGAGFDLLELELQRLAIESRRQHAVVMHRFFGGLTIHETAELLGVSTPTVERDWRIARARLFERLSGDHSRNL